MRDSTVLEFSAVAKQKIITACDQTDIPEAAWRITKFFAHESCGQCTPCREGTGWMEKVARRVADGHGKPEDIDLLASIAHGIAGNTICALGDAAAWAMLGFLTKFRGDFEAAVSTRPAAAAGDRQEWRWLRRRLGAFDRSL